MPDDAENTVHYINTDLLLAAPIDLGLLAAALIGQSEADGCVSCLHIGRDESGYQAHFEAFGPDGSYFTPQESIQALLNAIEHLPQSMAPAWQACSKRTLDIGYESGDVPRSVSHPIPIDMLARMQILGIDLCITVYASS